MTQIRSDVLVIGSGAAGATIAATLAESSPFSIVLVEKGPYYGREFFDQNELDMSVLLAENGGRTTADGGIPVAGGECVGGGTTVNYALCFDPIPSVWEDWKLRYGLVGFSLDPNASDYGIPGLSLARAARDVRLRCSVHQPLDREVNGNNRLFAEGCRRLGISARKFDLNMRGCVGCGFCGQGCAYDAKRGTMVTYLADALRNGVRLVHHCSIDELVVEPSLHGSRVVGAVGSVTPTRPGSRANSIAAGPVSFEASLVIVTAGAVESPALLQRSRISDSHDRIGRGLILHPSLPVAGVFAQKVVNYRGITGSYCSDHFYRSHGFMLECLFDHPIGAAIALPGFGADHFELMLDYTRLAGFGAMLVDTPVDANRVVWDESTNHAAILYVLGEKDKQRLRFAAARMVEIMFAAGAEKAILASHERLTPRGDAVFLAPPEAAYCDGLAFRPNETLLSSAHAQASVKMSEDPRFGFVDSRGEAHGTQGLIVCDSSAFPTSCGANPMIALMSLARYQGLRIAGELKRYR